MKHITYFRNGISIEHTASDVFLAFWQVLSFRETKNFKRLSIKHIIALYSHNFSKQNYIPFKISDKGLFFNISQISALIFFKKMFPYEKKNIVYYVRGITTFLKASLIYACNYSFVHCISRKKIFGHFFFFRNVLSTRCTTIPLLESPTRETFECTLMSNATDGILSLISGNECSGPLPIDSVIYTNWAGDISNILRHHSFDGYCENLAQGTVSVELWVGKCSGSTLGDAYTGWNSVSRIMVEEVPPSQ